MSDGRGTSHRVAHGIGRPPESGTDGNQYNQFCPECAGKVRIAGTATQHYEPQQPAGTGDWPCPTCGGKLEFADGWAAS
jgi:hypothetical protein